MSPQIIHSSRRDQVAKVQVAVFMSQVVTFVPGDCGVPVMLTPIAVASSARLQAFFGGGSGSPSFGMLSLASAKLA